MNTPIQETERSMTAGQPVLAPDESGPKVQVAGECQRAKAVVSLLTDIHTPVEQDKGALDLLGNLHRDVAAAVLVTPLPVLPSEAAVSLLRVPSSRTRTPVLIVVPEELDDAKARLLYERGAYAVFSWPRDGLLLARTVASLMATEIEDGCSLREQSFHRALERRLGWVAGLADDVSVDVRGGDQILRGSVDSSWKKRKLVEFAAAIPGVEHVDASELYVQPASIDPDLRSVTRRARRAVADVSERLARCVGVSVKEGGAAIVFGTLASSREYTAIATALGAIEGITSVFDATRKNPFAARLAGRRAATTRAQIERARPGLDVEVCVIRDTALLTGQVADPETSGELEAIAASQHGVRRVANHLEIRPVGR